MNVLLVISMFAASSWGLKFSFTNNTELEIFRRQTLIMNCSSDVEIEWLIPDDSNALVKNVSSYESSIVINQTTKCDSGDYICRPKNDVTQFARIRIHVTGLRTSFKNGTNIRLQLGQAFNFSCSAEGGVSWVIPFIGSASIYNISPFEERVESNRSVESDSNTYVCRSKNNLNEFAWVHLYLYPAGNASSSSEAPSSTEAPTSSESLVPFVAIIILSAIAVLCGIGSVLYRKQILVCTWSPQTERDVETSDEENRVSRASLPPAHIPPRPPSARSTSPCLSFLYYNAVRFQNPPNPEIPSPHRSVSIVSNPPPQMLILGNSDVPHLDFIGKGGFGNVHLGCFGGQTLAFKYASKLQENDEQLLNEVEIMQNLNHPHILKLIGKVIADDGSSLVAVIFEFMRYGDLWNMIRKPNYVLSQVILTRMCRDIASGMEYLAENGIVHRDLACRNCLVDSAFTIKIADFGLSGYADENGIYQQQGDLRAAARWMAPECIDLAFSEKSDVWAYGIVLWEIYSGGRRPYDDMHLSDANKFVQDGGTLEIENEDCPEHIKRISESCWRWDPEERPSFSQILRLFQPATSL